MDASLRCGSLLVLGLGAIALASGRSAGAAEDFARASTADRYRVEYFELRSDPDGKSVGFASLHRTDSDGATQLEWQIRFPREDLNIWHAESRESNGQRWIWREVEPRRSRSVIAEQQGATLEVTEWGRTSAWRSVLPTGDSSAFPLELQERLRSGEVKEGNFALFDPLANVVENVRLEFADTPSAAQDELRRANLVREDGSLAGSWTFHETELVSFSWQNGGLIAVRIDPQSFPRRTVQASMPKPARTRTLSAR